MVPILSHLENFEGSQYWVTTDFRVGTSLELAPCDLETDNSRDYERRLVNFVRCLSPSILIRISLKAKSDNQLDLKFTRASEFKELGFDTYKVILHIETSGPFDPIEVIKAKFSKRPKNIHALCAEISKLKSDLLQNGFRTQELSEDEITSLFQDPTTWVKSSTCIETGTETIGVIRMVKLPTNEISQNSLYEITKALPKPFELTISLKSMNATTAKLFLERKQKQAASGKDVVSKHQTTNVESAILENFTSGIKLLQFELQVVFKRLSASDLMLATNEALSKLNLFADFRVETFGVAPSYIAMLPGSEPHVTLLETDANIPVFLPVWLRGAGFAAVETPSPRALTIDQVDSTVALRHSLLLSRDSGALEHFDLFNPAYNVFNSLIIGSSGKGKSVLTGLLSESLLNDSNISIIKVDVGGSHSKECELFGGIEHVLKLDSGSGINPFAIVSNPAASDADKVSILSRFLSVLILENDETGFSKQMRSEIEHCVQAYVENGPKRPSLMDFYNFAVDFPRRNLLARWTTGVYSSAFADIQNIEKSRTGPLLAGTEAEVQNSGTERPLVQFRAQGAPHSPRLRYYNFSGVFQAADPEFAQAGFAAVLAHFNTQLLSNDGMRYVLICDETPFFIKTCFDILKFTTANVRKFGHAVVLIAQLSTDLIVNGDTGIIENSPQRFLFSSDGDLKEFQERFALSDDHIDTLKGLSSIPGKYSEVLLQTGETSRKLLIKVTKEKYWQLTSSQPDRLKLAKLRTAVPELTLREAIKCLSAD